MKVFVLALFVVATLASPSQLKARFDNYAVYRFPIETLDQLKVMKQIEQNPNGYNFWKFPTKIKDVVDMVVPPHKTPEFFEMAEKLKLNTSVMVENIQTLIDDEVGNRPRMGRAAVDWRAYNTLDEIYAWMDSIIAQYPQVTGEVIGTSFQGRPVRALKISYKSGNPGVFLEANIHAREWIAGATTTWIINQLLTSTNSDIRDFAENFDWYIIPIANPDGYVYTWSTNRQWRKTRQPFGLCTGTDPNRNFNFRWMTGGSSSNSCSDTYAGPSALSEPECKAIADYYDRIASNIDVYLDFHSYSQLLMYPFGSSPTTIPNQADHQSLSTDMAASLKQRFGTEYKHGNIVDTLYVASGGSIDWVKGVHQTPLVFVYELRDTGRYGFILPPDQIIPNSQEVMDSLLTMVKNGRTLGYFKRRN